MGVGGALSPLPDYTGGGSAPCFECKRCTVKKKHLLYDTFERPTPLRCIYPLHLVKWGLCPGGRQACCCSNWSREERPGAAGERPSEQHWHWRCPSPCRYRCRCWSCCNCCRSCHVLCPLLHQRQADLNNPGGRSARLVSFVRGLIRHRPPRTPPSNSPGPPLLKGRLGIETGSNQKTSMSNRCQSMLNRCQIDP